MKHTTKNGVALLAGGLAVGSFVNYGEWDLANVVTPPGQAEAASRTQVPPPVFSMTGDEHEDEDESPLAKMIDSGQPLRLQLPGHEPIDFSFRDFPLLADGYRTTIGQSDRLDAGLRVFEGRAIGDADHVHTATLALANRSVAGVIRLANGGQVQLRSTDGGAFEALPSSLPELVCVRDPRTGSYRTMSLVGDLGKPDWSRAESAKLESRATSTTAKIDAWVLPFLNVYGVAGYVDGETTASGFSVGGLPPELASLLPNSFAISYSGPVYGVGVTLAAGHNQFFASLDANYTESDLDIGDSTIEAFVISPRIGITGDLGGLSGALYVGAMYQDVDEQQNGTVKFPIMGTSVPVGYDVISAAKEEWNYLVGANLKASESWNYGIEVGFSDRTHVMATLNYRF